MFIDFTANWADTPATLKTIAGVMAEGILLKYYNEFGKLPKIALYGATPHISTYKPFEKILQSSGLPVATFTDEFEAKAWLTLA